MNLFENYEDYKLKIRSLLNKEDADIIINQRASDYTRVFDLLDLEQQHTVLEYGCWPMMSPIILGYYAKESVGIDNFQFCNRVGGCPPYSEYEWFRRINRYNMVNVKVYNMDICCTIFPDKYFDRIMSLSTHEHIPDDAKALKEIFRILKDDGLAVLSLDYSIVGSDYIGDGRDYNKKSVKDMVSKTDFEIIGNPFPDEETTPPEVRGCLPILLRKKGFNK